MKIYRFKFEDDDILEAAEDCFNSAVELVEDWHGQAKVKLEAYTNFDQLSNTAEVNSDTEIGRQIANLFTAQLINELDSDVFIVERVDVPKK